MTSEPRVARNDPTEIEGSFDLAAHRCFACGELNAQGIRMPLHMEPDRAWSDLALDPAFQGWEGIAHGGIIATLLDEAMAWAIASREAFGFTARMSIEYHRPVPVGVPLRVEGRVVEAKRRILRTEAAVLDPATGDAYAVAEGVYVTAPPEQQRALRDRYRFAGATDGPGGVRRWRVRQALPAVVPDPAPDPARDPAPGPDSGPASAPDRDVADRGVADRGSGAPPVDTPDMIAPGSPRR